MPLLDVQRRGQQIGRIRIGQQVAVIKDGRDTGRTRPARLDTFRFTTSSETVAQAIAAYYGGDVRPWNGEYEVITGKDVIGVTVPPRDEVISQWYEMWTKGGCQRRCDSRREQISGGPCLCPHADDPDDHDEVTRMALERSRRASLNPPTACKAVTRVNVGIPDLPGLGVFRLDTGSYYAAVEMGDAAALMQMARERNVILPAQLRIDHRQRVANGETKKFPVPVLEVTATVRDLVTGALEAGGMAAQLPPAPDGGPRAITAGTPASPHKPATEPARPMTAQQIADAATLAQTRAQVRQLVAKATKGQCTEDLVCPDPRDPDVFESLRDWLTARLNQLPDDRPPATEDGLWADTPGEVS